MKRSIVWMLAVFCAVALGSEASAKDAKVKKAKKTPQQVFEKLDADADGKVTVEEFNAAANARFARLDADGDKTLTVEEFTAKPAKPAKKANKGAKKANKKAAAPKQAKVKKDS